MITGQISLLNPMQLLMVVRHNTGRSFLSFALLIALCDDFVDPHHVLLLLRLVITSTVQGNTNMAHIKIEALYR